MPGHLVDTVCVNCHKNYSYQLAEGIPEKCENCGLNPQVISANRPWTIQRALPLIMAAFVVALIIAISLISSNSGSMSSGYEDSGSGPGMTPVIVPTGGGYRSTPSSYSPSSRSGSYGSRYRSSGGPSRGK